MKSNLEKSIVIACLNQFSQRDKLKLYIVLAFQTFLAALDLLGVAAIGALGALSISGIESKGPGKTVSKILRILGIDTLSFQSQAVALGGIAVALLIARTLLSITFSRRTLFFLGYRSAYLSSRLISNVLKQPLPEIRKYTSQEIAFAATAGVEAITLKIIGSVINLVSDFALLLVLSIGLFILDPLTAITTMCGFALLAFSLYRLMSTRAGRLGIKNADFEIKSRNQINEVLDTYREAVVKNRRDYYDSVFSEIRYAFSKTSAEITFLPNISKYVIESAVILGAFLVAGLQFMINDATHAFGILSVFLAAGSRIAPAILRIQQSAVQVRISTEPAIRAISMLKPTLDQVPHASRLQEKIQYLHPNFEGKIELNKVSVTYPNKSMPSLKNVSFKIEPGQSVAIVGPSGAGKTTLVDTILGIVEPNEGEILISGLRPIEAFKKAPGAVAYVPQTIKIIDGSILENVALGYPKELIETPKVSEALRLAHLEEFSIDDHSGLQYEVGENGNNLSGGQRQRLGIARALFTKPELLVLDEATSSLDSETEQKISQSIENLKGKTTLILIAHRLSTVMNVDIVVYMDQGKILKTGSFEEVRESIPNFDTQAKLMGL